MTVRAAAAGTGALFGFVLAWSQLSNPDVIRSGLLFQSAYLYLLMGTTIPVAAIGVRLLRRFRFRAIATGEPVVCATSMPERRHVVGSVVFGLGWGIASSCPGPIAVQLAQGVPWALATFAGVGIGVWLYLRRQERSLSA